MMDNLTIKILLIDAIKITHMIKRCLKKMLTQGMREEEGVMIISEICSAVIHNGIQGKLMDPRSFILDYSICRDMFKGSLCNLCLSVSLRPYSVASSWTAQSLETGQRFTPTRISLFLDDRSIRILEGFLEDVPI